MSREPGADELRIRALLVANQVGPDAVPPKPAVRPRDWLDEILNVDDSSEPETVEEGEPGPAETLAPAEKAKPASKPRASKARKKKRKKAEPGVPRAAVDSRPASPRQSLADAWDSVPPRLRWLGYHASAAYLGWSTGLVGWATYVTAWIADTGPVGPQAVFWYVAAGGTVLLYRRTRSWWWPAAWLAAVPVTSTVVGVLLYAPHP
ncbi:hypothetical protein ACWD25_04060 [Streptomyces sp. NPDC002920]